MSVNKVFILGNLGADPELRSTSSQLAVCKLRVATSEFRKAQDGQSSEEKTEWHSITVFGRQAENCAQYLKKGRQVFVEGRLSTSKWQAQDGSDRYRTEIIANNVQFIGGRGERAEYNQMPSSAPNIKPQAESAAGMAQSVSFEDDDIPF